MCDLPTVTQQGISTTKRKCKNKAETPMKTLLWEDLVEMTDRKVTPSNGGPTREITGIYDSEIPLCGISQGFALNHPG